MQAYSNGLVASSAMVILFTARQSENAGTQYAMKSA